ncbi:MAG: hypothetical protein ACI88G_000071 [Woeseiaceae bacterium]|jgi:hypothetical protein
MYSVLTAIVAVAKRAQNNAFACYRRTFFTLSLARANAIAEPLSFKPIASGACRFLLHSIVAAISCTAAFAAEETSVSEYKHISAIRVDDPPVINGVLDDAAWMQAAVIKDVHQARPHEYAEPNERTEFYVVYDKDAIYIGAHFWDSEPDKITANVFKQGASVRNDDRITIIIDPFNDKRSGYGFSLNSNNVRRDGSYITPLDLTGEWDGIWQGKASRTDDGWTAEVAIPVKTLSFKSENDTWGFNVRREIVRTGERIAWVSHNGDANPSAAGELRGLRDLDTGLGLDVVTSLSLRQLRDFNFDDTDYQIEPSLNAFYKITPSMNGSLTINTDFSAVEADSRQVNLTRFNLFFPEKRGFFLKEADIFEFGRIGGRDRVLEISRVQRENGRPFFSRTIGLSGDNEPVDLEYGAKISGRMGQWNIGALSIRQAEFGGIDASDILVGRVTRNVLDESTVGVIMTSGDPTSNLDNTLVGVDFLYLNTNLPGGRTIEAGAWYQQSDTEGLDADDAAWGLQLRMPNTNGLRAGITVKEIQGNFNPALGFVNRRGVRDYIGELSYTYRPKGRYLREIFAGIDARRVERLDGGLDSSLISLRFLDISNHSSDRVQAKYRLKEEGLTEPFEISTGVIIPPGTYSFDEYGISINTGRHRTWSADASVFKGTDFDGEKRSVKGGLFWKPSKHFNLQGTYQYNDFELPQGNFVTRLITLQSDIVFSDTLSWVNLMQYDNVSNNLGINSRVHWIPEAGREMFFVINHNLLDGIDGFQSDRSEITLKANYTFRF